MAGGRRTSMTIPLRYALIGHPVAHSRSPAIHAGFARAAGVALHYALLDAAPGTFASTLRTFVAVGGRGGNVTLPYKEEALRFMDLLTPRAREAGAVNAFRVESGGLLTGDNTDGAGLVRDLTVNNGVRIAGTRVLVLGAGGAARGALAVLRAEKPAVLCVANRTADKARALAQVFGIEGSGFDELAGARFDLIVNATAASLAGAVPALPGGVLALGGVAYDMVYLDTPTAFQAWARQAGAALALDGWGMLVEQAAESWQFWFGTRPAPQALQHALSRRDSDP